MVQDRCFNGYLVLNWKTGAQRILNKRPSSEGPYEVVVRYNVSITIPDTPVPNMTIELELPETKITEAIASEI